MWVPKSVFIASKARLDALIAYELLHLTNTRYRASRGSARIQKTGSMIDAYRRPHELAERLEMIYDSFGV